MIFNAPYSMTASGRLDLHFHPDHLTDLRKSGLTDQTIRSAGVYSIRPSDLALFFRSMPPSVEPGCAFPIKAATSHGLSSFRHWDR